MPLPTHWPSPLPFPWPPTPATEADLPHAQHQMLGSPSDCTDCGDPCHPHPFVTSQLNKVTSGMRSAYISNALKGDLILCPGDGSGTIGGLLGNLNPQQVYSHMGIMVADYTTIRHATGVQERIQAYPSGKILGIGVGAPIDGFEPQKVKFGWPGTITQTVADAFNATQDFDNSFDGALYSDRDNPDSDHQWRIHELSFYGVWGLHGDFREALVVSPCTGALSNFPALRSVAQRVADQAMKIRGHYRFFAYTRAAIANDPAFAVAKPFSVFRFHKDSGTWVEEEGTAPDPHDPCKTVPTSSTIPLVCSSFVWAAVEQINHDPKAGIRIRLDPDLGQDLEPDPRGGCKQLIAPQQAADPRDFSETTPEGLYFYPEAELVPAAQGFHDALVEMVQKTVESKVTDFWNALDKKVGIHIPPVGWGLLLVAVAGGLGPVSTLLGISVADAASVVDFVTGMPDDVANQMCNLFASDSSDEESNAWNRPGDGRAVSPDDIVWFWDSTRSMVNPLTGLPEVQGLYGENKKLVLKVPQWGTTPQCTWRLSPGTSRMRGQVRFRGTGQFVPFATVTVSCHQCTTNADGVYELIVPAGQYWATAGWQNPQDGFWWEVLPQHGQPVDLPYGKDVSVNFLLDPPPVEDRVVYVHGKLDAVDRVLVGHDLWIHTPLNGVTALGHYGNPLDPTDHFGESGKQPWGIAYSDEGNVNISYSLDWHPGGFVSGKVHAEILDGSDIDAQDDRVIPKIPPGGTYVMPFIFLNGGGFEPDEATINLTFENTQQA